MLGEWTDKDLRIRLYWLVELSDELSPGYGCRDFCSAAATSKCGVERTMPGYAKRRVENLGMYVCTIGQVYQSI